MTETKLPEMKPLNSKSIKAAGFQDGAIYLEFKGGGLYRYRGFGQDVYDGFFDENLKSVGAYFREKMKGHKDFERLK